MDLIILKFEIVGLKVIHVHVYGAMPQDIVLSRTNCKSFSNISARQISIISTKNMCAKFGENGMKIAGALAVWTDLKCYRHKH